MFFKPKLYTHENARVALAKDTRLTGEIEQALFDCAHALFADCVARSEDGDILCTSVTYERTFPKSVKAKIAQGGVAFSKSEEAYAILIGKTVKIYAPSGRGLLYALATIKQLLEANELYEGFLYDHPILGTRGYRVFLPSRRGFDSFKKIVDFLVEYRYNSIILEVGGAMEYKRHPEINVRWAEFAKETKAYSGRTHEIQFKTYPWTKNSIHTDNAEGDILTQDECRTLVAYCRSRGLRVIPECPTFSHCDYLVMAHPEIREREGDAYPDTYCPNHPDTYTYVFDILEEVIDVFKPEIINIGHDEMYSIGVCPRCKGTPAPILYANDIKKLRDFLAERGIRTMMWGEKLLKAHHFNGAPIGGSGHGKGDAHVPALFPCRDLIPRDVIMLHWYNVFNYKYDRIYHDRGFETYYGNLNAMNVKHWDLRVSWGIGGGFVSNWGSFSEEYMQRNQQYFELINTAYAFWCDDYEKMGEKARMELTMRECHRLKKSKVQNPLCITHVTRHKIPYKCFYDGIFIEDDVYMLGSYEISYEDGSVCTLPVKYGTHIGTESYDDYLHQSAFVELSYTTMPQKRGDGWAYECVYENPNPQGRIKGIAYKPLKGREDVFVEMLAFSLPIVGKESTVHRTRQAAEEFAWDGGTVELSDEN